MSNLYTTEPNQFNSGPNPSIGFDVDNNIVSQYSNAEGNTYQIMDYDILSRPKTSGTNVLIPAELDTGIPEIPTQKYDKDGNPIYNLDSMLLQDENLSFEESLNSINNGRVGDINVISDKISKDSDIVINKDNQENSIKGILETTALSENFLSEMNLGVIQQVIRYRVNKGTGKIISNQSEESLYIIMRSILLQYGNFRVSTQKLIEEIQSLNQKVIDYCVENISSNTMQYLGYIKDIGKLPQPLSRPVYHNKQNYTYDISNLI
tara:strand:- start:2174 stop:2965 length:792 start_codon:yes stop_codon:yes gene_type:complete